MAEAVGHARAGVGKRFQYLDVGAAAGLDGCDDDSGIGIGTGQAVDISARFDTRDGGPACQQVMRRGADDHETCFRFLLTYAR